LTPEAAKKNKTAYLGIFQQLSPALSAAYYPEVPELQKSIKKILGRPAQPGFVPWYSDASY